MRRQVCWVARTSEGGKREVRVSFLGRRLKWQFLEPDRATWDYDSPPKVADWDALLARMEARYQRRNVSHRDLECVRVLRQEAIGTGEAG